MVQAKAIQVCSGNINHVVHIRGTHSDRQKGAHIIQNKYVKMTTVLKMEG